MATTCTFLSNDSRLGAASSEVSGDIDIDDVSFLNTSDPLAPVVDTVTGNLQRTIDITAAQAATAGIPSGTYEKVGATTFRKVNNHGA